MSSPILPTPFRSLSRSIRNATPTFPSKLSLARDALDKVVAYFGSAPFSHYSVVLEYLKPLPPPHVYNFSMEHLDSGTFFMDVDHAITAASSAIEKESARFNYAHHIAHSWIPKRCYGAGYIPFNWEMTPVIDTIWFNEGFGRYVAIAALADALPKDEAARYRTAKTRSPSRHRPHGARLSATTCRSTNSPAKVRSSTPTIFASA